MGNTSKLTKAEKEARLQAELEETWQSESPLTAKRTEFADEVDGELGTRDQADSTD